MSYTERYRRLYRALKGFGFSPAKALEILVDARRGDQHALLACRVAARFK